MSLSLNSNLRQLIQLVQFIPDVPIPRSAPVSIHEERLGLIENVIYLSEAGGNL